MSKVFLGGTCNESVWRNELIPMLKIDYFNPVVEDWTPECQENEEREKKICDFHLYVITPKMKGVFSIAEAVNDSMKLPARRCVFCVTKEEDDRDWSDGEMKSLDATAKLIQENGGVVFKNLDSVVVYLNSIDEKTKQETIEHNLDYYKKRTEHLVQLYNKLVHQILPEGWYCMAMDAWTCEEEELTECISRLYRRGVQRRIRRK